MLAREGWNPTTVGRLAGFLLLALSLTLAGTALAQSEDGIPAEEAGEHVGEDATVCGTIVEAVYITRMEGEPTFLNFGAAYPDQVFSIVIWAEDTPKFRRRPDRYYRDREVCVTGTIEPSEDGPRIVVTDPAAIEISDEESDQ